jgi:hypothetical protein
VTTDTSNRSVLLIGASQRILDDSIAALCDLGYTAQATSDFFSDITGRFDVTHIDLVSLGGQVPPDRKDELKQQIGAINPRVIVLDSLAGIPGLIASQVQEAFTADRQDPAQAPAYTPGDRSIRLTLQDPAAVKVTVWWRTSTSASPQGNDNSQAAGSLSPASSDSQATDRWGTPAQSASRDVLPNPAGAQTSIGPRASPSSSQPSRRGRATKPPN